MNISSKLCLQDYGTGLLVFIKGDNHQEASDIWLSMFNWGMFGRLGSQPEYVTDYVIKAWTTKKKLAQYLFNRRISEMYNTRTDEFKGKRHGFKEIASIQAKSDYDAIPVETFRSVNSDFETFEFGTVKAEKPDDTFVDVCFKMAF